MSKTKRAVKAALPFIVSSTVAVAILLVLELVFEIKPTTFQLVVLGVTCGLVVDAALTATTKGRAAVYSAISIAAGAIAGGVAIERHERRKTQSAIAELRRTNPSLTEADAAAVLKAEQAIRDAERKEIDERLDRWIADRDAKLRSKAIYSVVANKD